MATHVGPFGPGQENLGTHLRRSRQGRETSTVTKSLRIVLLILAFPILYCLIAGWLGWY